MSDERAREDRASTERALSELVGARVDRAFVCEETGLVSLLVFDGVKRVLSIATGPVVGGVGLGTRVARSRDDSSKNLVTALRAHVVDHRVRAVTVDDDGALWLSFGGDGAVSRLALWPGRKGGATVYAADGRVIARAQSRADAEPEALWGDERPVETRGDALTEASDRHQRTRLKIELARALRAARVTSERRADAVRGDLARLDSVERLQKIGRLLLAQGAKIPRGTSKATLEDWEEGGEVEVAIDPAKPAKSQAETYFAKARRYQRGEVVMRKRLAESEARAQRVAELEAEVAAADPSDTSAWDVLVARARSLGAKVSGAQESAKGAKPAREEKREAFHRYRDERGRKILVGRGGADNDRLTTEVARPHDLWLHVKNRTGAHVVVPLDKGQTCPAETLVDAATLAAHFSDARGEAVCEVSYVPRRYVRKPKGSAPGAVTYDHEKVLVLRVQALRLERLLASRDE